MKKPLSIASFLVLLAAATLLGLSGVYLVGKQSKGQAEAELQAPPPAHAEAAGAFVRGGAPQVTEPLRAVFAEALPTFVIALQDWGRRPAAQSDSIADDLREARAAVVGAMREAEVSAALLGSFEAVIDESMRAAQVPDEELDDAADQIMKATLELNEAIAAAGMGFFVDTDIQSHSGGNRSVLFFSFEISRVVLYRSLGHQVRTLRVRRLDKLTRIYSLWGFTSAKRKDAVVLDNIVEKHMMDLLPALSEEIRIDPFHLSKKDSETAWFNRLRTLATAIIREELGNAGDEELQALGQLLARRVEIHEEWNGLLESRQMSIDLPTSLAIKWKYRQELKGLVTHKAMDELDKIQEELAKPAILASYAKVHDHVARSVERHETQHRLDYAKLYNLPMPPALEEYVGEVPEGPLGHGSRASSAKLEMSAYLSELARDPLTPKVNLTLLMHYLLSKPAWGMSESYAALVIVEGLADELGIKHGEFAIGRSINRATIAEVYEAMCSIDNDTFRAAAKTLWERSFETDLPVLELIAR